MAKKWILPPDQPDEVRQLADALRVSELTARLLVDRGLHEPAAAQRFLQPSLHELTDPCTDEAMTAKAALEAYKYQPRLEKRFCQLKSVHNVAPTLFKKVERVEAIMLLFFLALILQAVIEREVRKKMKATDIEALSIYPGSRP